MGQMYHVSQNVFLAWLIQLNVTGRVLLVTLCTLLFALVYTVAISLISGGFYLQTLIPPANAAS